MLRITLLCALAIFFPVSHGNEFEGLSEIRDVTEVDWTQLTEFKLRTKRGVCKDESAYCGSYKSYCNHPSYKGYLKDNCKMTCNYCGKECADLMDCEIYRNYCNHKDYHTSLKYYCKATCSFMPSSNTRPATNNSSPYRTTN
ncbi:uncharacterized protein LOC111339848 [Stylophora pistillata]|uniref:uncharacterized protein LOC111339848 n=1 Tax=Stylophora pistillata TaxID=50429 RepID=UPI000C04A8E8|nr:uncharacterized protein LOC111339848 [Stylophora pistillata]